MKEVARIKSLQLFPVKSAGGIELKDALITTEGLQDPTTGIRDRHFVVIGKNGRMVTGTPGSEPRLVLIQTQIEDNHLMLSAPGMETFKLSLDPDTYSSNKETYFRLMSEDTIGRDCGDEIAEWLTRYFDGRPNRLLYATPELPRRELWKKYQQARKEDRAAYQNMTAMSIMSAAAIEDLNSRLDKKVDERSFRANIMVDNCHPYAEDYWFDVQIGEAKLSFGKHTNRCLLTTVDRDNGKPHPKREPWTTLKTYRQMPKEHTSPVGCLGISYFVDNPGRVKVGDPVYDVTSEAKRSQMQSIMT